MDSKMRVFFLLRYYLFVTNKSLSSGILKEIYWELGLIMTGSHLVPLGRIWKGWV